MTARNPDRGSSELAMAARGLVARGVVTAVYDDKGVQLVDVVTHDGVARTGVEVWQPYGFAASPPEGGQVLLLAVGGDQSDLLALPASHSGARFGGQQRGEAALYDDLGNRAHIRRGGLIELLASALVRIKALAARIEAANGLTVVGPTTLQGDVTIAGNLNVQGSITATGTITASGTVHGSNI